MKKIKAVFFDLDGVLTKEATGTKAMLNYIKRCTAIDFERFSEAYLKKNQDLLYGKTTHLEIWDEICTEVGQTIDYSVLENAMSAVTLDYKILGLIRALRSRGYYVGLITDNKKDRVEHLLKTFRLIDDFTQVVVSSDLKSGKKDRLIFDTILEKNGLLYEEAFFIDNDEANLVIPNANGMTTFYYNHTERPFEELLKSLETCGVKTGDALQEFMDSIFMEKANELALVAKSKGEDPFGAILVKNGEIVYETHDGCIEGFDPTLHAERRAISEYCQLKRRINLEDITLYSSSEPCAMCSGAIHWARIPRVVYGVSQVALNNKSGGKPKMGCEVILNQGHKKVDIKGCVLADECFQVISSHEFIPKAQRLMDKK